MNTNTLPWADLRKLGSTDKANRYYPTDEVCREYVAINGYRGPSRAWPWSYAKPLLTAKFAKWARQNHPEWAAEHGL